MIREKLALAYQILAHLGLDDHTYTHLSARSQKGDSYFIYPFGLRFEEVTPDTLMHISLEGAVLEGQEYQYNDTGYRIHGSIYKARPDIHSIFHIHTPATVAVSALEQGLMPISQWALHFYNLVSYHTYGSLILDESQGDTLIQDLGDRFIMFLRNHGSLTCGRTIQEAMFYTYHLEQACKTQCLALATNQKLIMPSPSICQKSVQDLLSFEKDLGMRDWKSWVRLVESKSKSR